MIDWARVSELRDEIGAEDFGEVVDLFLEEVESEIAALRLGYEPATLESRLHFLKGSALNLGFEAFSQLCQHGETAASKGHHNDIDVPATLVCFDQSKTTFLNGLNELSAA